MDPSNVPFLARHRRVPGLAIDIVPAGIILDLLNWFTRGVGMTLGFLAVNALAGIV